MKHFVIASLIAFPLSVMAHGNRAEVTLGAVDVATKKFVKEQAANVKNYRGVKGWIEGTAMKVEVYLLDNTKFAYTCHHTDTGGQMVIHCE